MSQGFSIIYVVDDDESVCRALKLLLTQNGFRVETFTRAAEFLGFKHLKIPSCVISDMRMPDIGGLALQEAMLKQQILMPIIFLTGFGDIPMTVKAMQGGAVDFLPKPFTEENLLNAIERAMVKSKDQNKCSAEVAKIKRDIDTLSPRELEVFHLVAQGFMNKQIASRWGTALQTIKVHRGRVMQKMHAKTITELTRLAQKAGINSSLA